MNDLECNENEGDDLHLDSVTSRRGMMCRGLDWIGVLLASSLARWTSFFSHKPRETDGGAPEHLQQGEWAG